MEDNDIQEYLKKHLNIDLNLDEYNNEDNYYEQYNYRHSVDSISSDNIINKKNL